MRPTRATILGALRGAEGDFDRAARALRLAPVTLYRRAFELGISGEVQRVGHEARQLASLRATCAIALDRIGQRTMGFHVSAGGYPSLAALAALRRRARLGRRDRQAWSRAVDLLGALAGFLRPDGAELVQIVYPRETVVAATELTGEGRAEQ